MDQSEAAPGRVLHAPCLQGLFFVEESLAERNGLAIVGKKHMRTRSDEAHQAVPMIGKGFHTSKATKRQPLLQVILFRRPLVISPSCRWYTALAGGKRRSMLGI